jgi:hypothetical protein
VSQPPELTLSDRQKLDQFLAAALIGQPAPTSHDATARPDTLVERIAYHGIAGLLTNGTELQGWTPELVEQCRSIAVAQSMWELRHAAVLKDLLAAFHDARLPALLLKGTAIAYDLYANPAERARGDSDLLIHDRDLDRARSLLQEAGFDPPGDGAFLPPSLRSQESWFFEAGDGSRHCVDLHWRPLNSPALDVLFTTDEWFQGARSLRRLASPALAPSRPLMLLHACLHRSMHDCSPYQVGAETYFGGDRLIWLYDIWLLCSVFSDDEWCRFCGFVQKKGVANACVDGLEAAATHLGLVVPAWVREALRAAPSSAYFGGGQLRRAVLDWKATPGIGRKWRYLHSRMLPDRRFMRAKYPKLASAPLPILYARRFVELLRRRP